MGRCLIHRSSTRDDIGDALNGQRMLLCCVLVGHQSSECLDLRQRISRRQGRASAFNATLETRLSPNPLSTSTPQRFIACGPLAVSAHIMADDFARLVFQAKAASISTRQ